MKAFKIFKIKPEERVQSLVALAVILLLNALFIYRMHDLFMQEGFGPYWKVFERELHLAGYDPLTYLGVTDWDVVYQVYRHPLLSFMIWPLYLLNECLTCLLGVNCVQYLVALPLIVCSFYSYIFLYRIHREVITLDRLDATLLTAVTTAFCGPVAFIGLAVPHMARLLLTTDNHRQLLPATMLCGAVVALVCNLLCFLPGEGGVIPLNAVTPLIGAPVIIYVILINHESI